MTPGCVPLPSAPSCYSFSSKKQSLPSLLIIFLETATAFLVKCWVFLMGEGGETLPGAMPSMEKSLSIFQMMHKLNSIMLYIMKLKVLFRQSCTAVGHSALSD